MEIIQGLGRRCDPNPAPRGFDPLAYIADYFTTVEINSSYYAQPKPTTARRWINSVCHNREFRFTAKLFYSFTHERKPAPADEHHTKQELLQSRKQTGWERSWSQFPWSFKNEPEPRAPLGTSEALSGISVGRRSPPRELDNGGDSGYTFAALGLGLCNIDVPLFHRSVKPAAHTTSSIGYVRLHGRNYQNWFSPKSDVRARYDYLYRPEELEPR
jgi:uncharacterized protein YecE (DUF72 family)